MIRNLHFGGRAVRFYVNGAAASDLADFLFNQVPRQGSTQPHVSLSLKDSSMNAEIRFTFPVAEHPGGSDEGHIADNADQHTSEVRGSAAQIALKVLHEVDFHLANLASDGLYLHAASLARQGQALIMPASSGSGKSTLTYWLTQRGFHYMSDEATFVSLNSRKCTGFTRPAVLKSGSLDLFPNLAASSKLELRRGSGKPYGWLIGVSALNTLGMDHTSQIKSFIFPHYQPGSGFIYEQLSSAHTAFELARCLINARNLVQNGFPEVLRLAQAVPAWRLVYGDLQQVEGFFDNQF